MRFNWIPVSLVSICILTISACSGDSSSPTSPSTDSPAAATGLNLTGTWTGEFKEGSETKTGLRWTATQTGAGVSGPLVLTFVEDGVTININGSLAGNVSGTQLTATTFSVTAGSIPFPELATCTISGTGTYAATTASVSGPMAMTFGPPGLPCVDRDGGVNDTTTATWQLSLTK